MSDETKIPLPRSLQEIVGSLLFASETPLTAGDLRSAVRAVEADKGEDAELVEIYRTCTSREIDSAIKGLAKALEVAGCGFELVCTGGAYRIQTVASCGRYVRALLKLDRPSRLGRASLETLAIIAYRQPITKGEVEEIRGVDVSGNVKTLMDLQLIRLVGKSELPGHPFLYGTTPLFLEHFGLASLQQLNEIDPTLQRSNPRAQAAKYKKPVEDKPENPETPESPVPPESPENPEPPKNPESPEPPENPEHQAAIFISEDEFDEHEEFKEDEFDEDEDDEEYEEDEFEDEDEFDEDDDEEEDEDEEDDEDEFDEDEDDEFDEDEDDEFDEDEDDEFDEDEDEDEEDEFDEDEEYEEEEEKEEVEEEEEEEFDDFDTYDSDNSNDSDNSDNEDDDENK